MFLNTSKERGKYQDGVEVKGDLSSGGLKFERWNEIIIMLPTLEWLKLTDNLIHKKTQLIDNRFGKSKGQMKEMFENVIKEHKQTIDYLQKEIDELE